jgi:hypothetical protein
MENLRDFVQQYERTENIFPTRMDTNAFHQLEIHASLPVK